eukprot:TRINITY_DN11757_c0_g2_i2.p1 TRINITY_DN11757_c0_g2~~TRINITY_DN11757_c0_g2_i2.p1  ORF type:complete len:522 (-),score=132.64 TRINITY_DN11757_c0_g2_i2:34-1599(-)
MNGFKTEGEGKDSGEQSIMRVASPITPPIIVETKTFELLSDDLGMVEEQGKDQLDKSVFSANSSNRLEEMKLERTLSTMDKNFLGCDSPQRIESGKLTVTVKEWSTLQDKLKNEYTMISHETAAKETMLRNLSEQLKEYHKRQLKIREANEMNTKRERYGQEDFKEWEHQKVLLENEAKILGAAFPYIKDLLFTMVGDPAIVYTMARGINNSVSSKDESLIETLSMSFFDNIAEDEPFESNLLRVLYYMIKLEFERTDNYKDLFRRSSFAERMLLHYTKRREGLKYAKFLLKNPLIKILQDSELIELDVNNLVSSFSSKDSRESHSTFASAERSSYTPNARDTFSDRTYSVPHTDNFAINVDKSVGKTAPQTAPQTTNYFKTKYSRFISPNGNEEESIDGVERRRLTMDSDRGNSLGLTPNIPEEVQLALLRNVERAKNLSKLVLDSVFENLYYMPIGIRIVCKLIYKMACERIAHVPPQLVLSAFLFERWLFPILVNPQKHHLLTAVSYTHLTLPTIYSV